MIAWLLDLLDLWLPAKRRRLSYRVVSYLEAEDLLTDSAHERDGHRWTLAPEEDENQVMGVVHLERLQAQLDANVARRLRLSGWWDKLATCWGLLR